MEKDEKLFLWKILNLIFPIFIKKILHVECDTDPLYLQTLLRQIVFVRLQLKNAEENEKKIVENDLLSAWKVRNNLKFFYYGLFTSSLSVFF